MELRERRRALARAAGQQRDDGARSRAQQGQQATSQQPILQSASPPPIRPRRAVVWRAVGAGAACLLLVLLLYVRLRSRTLAYALAAAELAFFVHYWCLCVPHLGRISSAEHAAPPEHDPAEVKDKLLRYLMRVDNVMVCMQSWFIEAQPGDIKRDNLMELFAYAVWYRSIDQMAAEGLLPELEDLVQQLERHLGQRVPEGYNPQLRFMSHLWEPLRHVYRPLLFYVVMELLALLCHVALIAGGFRLHDLGGISYYTLNLGPQQVVQAISGPLVKHKRSASASSASAARSSSEAGSPRAAAAAFAPPPPQSQQPQSQQQQQQPQQPGLPIVFLHGVGAGLLPYLALVFRLAALGRPLILPESKHVSMRLVSWLPTVDDMADATAAILAAHGMERAAVVAHSYGTMVASRLVLKYDSLVDSLCLIDPVCFAMFMPDLLRNFLYTRHNSGCLAIDVIMALVSSELHCAANFSRKFFWTNINLWDDFIPDRTLVVLSGRDILSPTAQLHKWLTEHTHAQVMHKPDMAHAGVLIDMQWQAQILAAFLQLEQLEQRPAAPAACCDADAGAAATRDAAAPAAGAAPALAAAGAGECDGECAALLPQFSKCCNCFNCQLFPLASSQHARGQHARPAHGTCGAEAAELRPWLQQQQRAARARARRAGGGSAGSSEAAEPADVACLDDCAVAVSLAATAAAAGGLLELPGTPDGSCGRYQQQGCFGVGLRCQSCNTSLGGASLASADLAGGLCCDAPGAVPPPSPGTLPCRA